MDFNTEPTTPDDSSMPGPITETIEQSLNSPGINEQKAVCLTFVNDLDVPEVQVQDIQQQDEYETDLVTERDDEVDFDDQVGKSSTCICKSGFMKSALFDGYISIAVTAKIS